MQKVVLHINFTCVFLFFVNVSLPLHIIICKELNKSENEEKIPDFEEIYKGNINNQVKIVRKFLENMKKRRKLENG